MITPYLILVLGGFALFMLVLGAIWIRNFADDIAAARLQRAPALAKAKPASGVAAHDARQTA